MRRRNAFTLVELLVAMALIMFMMAILSSAFVSATNTFRTLKATGDLANKLRAVVSTLQSDLAADHFEGKKRLSNPNFWMNGPPEQGFFRIYQGSAGTTEANDGYGLGSYRSIDHMLAFTKKMRGDQVSDFLTAGPAGGGSYLGAQTNFGPGEARYQTPGNFNFQWGEVTWFLVPQTDPLTGLQDTTIPYADSSGNSAPAVGLYSLIRNQRLAVPDATGLQQPAVGLVSQYLETSFFNNGANLIFNTPMDLTVPMRRFDMANTMTGGANAYAGIFANGSYQTLTLQGAPANLAGSDLQITDVISFDVRLLVSTSTSGVSATVGRTDPFVTLFDPVFAGYQNGNPVWSIANGPRVFDTWSSVVDNSSGVAIDYSQWSVNGHAASIPLWNAAPAAGSLPAPIILAIQITIRIWDPKTYQTREVTIVQAM